MYLKDKIRGAIAGLAYGDALGVGAVFMTRHEVASYYPDGLRHFNQTIRDPYRSQWKRGEYTNNTVLTTLMLEAVMEGGGFVTYNLCKKFQDWFAEEERDIAPFLRLYCENSEWLENPISVAHQLWHASGLAEASNEPLHRAVVTGLTSEDKNLKEHTRKFVLCTHDDSRCVATTIIMAKVIRNALKDKKDDIDQLLKVCNEIDNRSVHYLKKAWDGDIDSLQIDDPDSQLWTRKSMAASLWAYWHHENSGDSIHDVIDMGGDAATNGALAGVLAGLKYGYESLPMEKEKLIRMDYLLELSDSVREFAKEKVFA